MNARENRRRELDKLTKARLIRMCRTGITRPGGGVSYIEGGMYPLDQWRKDEVIGSILAIEFPPDEAGHQPEPVEMCPAGCGCRLGTEDADARECACDGPCCFDEAEPYEPDHAPETRA